MAKSNKTRTDQNEETKGSDRTYFKDAHLGNGPPIIVLSAYPNKKKHQKTGVAEVGYKVFDGSKHKCPRSRSRWLDGKPLEFIEAELQSWKDRVNRAAEVEGRYFPDFYSKHRAAFLKWCHKTAKQSTISGYESHLGNHIFPYFCLRLRKDEPKEWADHITNWEKYLEKKVDTPRTRNYARSALRRYFKFLFSRRIIDDIPSFYNEPERSKGPQEQVIPGDTLPDWSDIVGWLKTLPPGRERFVITVAAAFGIRPSEALGADKYKLIGGNEIDSYPSKAHIINQARKHDVASLFLEVDFAVKKKQGDSTITKVIGEIDDDPKSGPYLASCIDHEIANFLLELISNKENEDTVDYDHVYKYLKANATDFNGFPFSQYALRDFRRYHITMSAYAYGDLFLVARLHGQKSEEIVKRYYQWEQTRRRIRNNEELILIPIEGK